MGSRSDVIDPGLIGDDRTSWEARQEARRKVTGLESRLDAKHQKLERLDADAEILNSGDLTMDKLDSIEGRLKISKLEPTIDDELRTNPELLPPSPVNQFKMAAAIMPPPSKFDLDRLAVNAIELNR